jgi:hypothetical protein
MNKENFYLPFLLFFLTLAFLCMSILVWFKKNNPVFVSGKIKLGAAIITLTSVLYACNGNQAIEQDSCYKTVSDDTLVKSETLDSANSSASLNKDTLTNYHKKKNLKLIKPNHLKDSFIVQPPIQDATCYISVNLDDSL